MSYIVAAIMAVRDKTETQTRPDDLKDSVDNPWAAIIENAPSIQRSPIQFRISGNNTIQ